MPLSVGTKLGRYEILAPIGFGGMGEVYRARDTRLERIVAIKILPSHLSSPQARERFDREAKAISSLSHPHICPLYDVGHQDGTQFLVMEYLEGETVADRLKKGPLSIEQVLQYATEITEALDAAHKRGVIHRDLKPGNIMLTKVGAKLLDFGLAKLLAFEAVAGTTELVTKTSPLTGEGTILGTLHYMAPEQLEGKEADARTDIFALGAVVYEMATGRKAFEGKSQASLISAIMTAEPRPISQLQVMSPRPLDHLVQVSLAKDPDARWQTAHDVLVHLKWIARTETTAEQTAAAPASRKKKHSVLPWSIAATACIATIVLAFLVIHEKPAPAQMARFLIEAPRGVTLDAEDYPVVSPDSQSLVFGGVRGNERKTLWVRRLDSLTAQQLAGTDDALYPFWSPDNRWIGFFAAGKLKKIQAGGGAVEILCDAPSPPFGGSWSRKGVILFSGGHDSALLAVSDLGGDPAPQHHSRLWPHFLPDGDHYLAFAHGKVIVGSTGSSEATDILALPTNAMFSPPGFLVYSSGPNVLAQAFDISTRRVSGGPVTIADRVKGIPLSAGAEFSVSTNGVVAYRQSSNLVQLVWYSREGKRLSTIGDPGQYEEIQLSSDEKRLAVESTTTNTERGDIWIVELNSGIFSRFTFGPRLTTNPVWSPDGRELVFASNRAGFWDLYRKVVGGGPEQLLLASHESKWPHQWLKDGKSVLFIDGRNFFRLPLEGEPKAAKLLESQFNNDLPRLSPDERSVAFQSNESGRWEVYLATFPAFSDRRQISANGGCQPMWRRDGRELFFRALDGKMMALDVDGPQAGAPHALFQTPGTMVPQNVEYAVSTDGRRFLLREPAGETADSIGLVLNWTAGLKK